MADVTYAQVNSVLKYDAETGKLFWRPREACLFTDDAMCSAETRATMWNRRYAGKEAMTSKNSSGYPHGTIFDKSYKAHRIAWLLHFGEWPKHTIDHINGDPADNRISNLRDVPHRVNLRNVKRHCDNKSGVTGVCYQRASRKWMAFINGNSGLELLGTFDRKAEAVVARHDAERNYGYHQNHGRD